MCVVLLPGALVPRWRLSVIAAVGTTLPDLASRLPSQLLEQLWLRGVAVPDWLMTPWGVFHLPLPLVLICVLIALGFRPSDRAAVLGALWVGVALHLGVDLLQDHHGQGYRLLFPLSHMDVELGLIHSEATPVLAPWFALVTGGAWTLRLWLRQVREG
jgi:hypothetical protein